MSLYPLEFETNLIQFVMIVVMTGWYALRKRDKGGVAGQMFLWGLVAHVFMNIYWYCMIIVEGGGKYATFTACDTATIAFVLIWSSMFYLRNKVDFSSKMSYGLIPVSMTVFALLNVVWWTIWSGNLIINILWGIPFSILFYMVCYALHRKDVITTTVKNIWIILTLTLTVCESVFPLLDDTAYVVMDWFCFAIWLLLIVIFTVIAFKDEINKTTWLFVAMIFSLYAQYLSDGIRYSFFSMMETIVLFLLIFNYDAGDLGEEEQI